MTKNRIILSGLVSAPLLLLLVAYTIYRVGLQPVSSSSTAQEFSLSPGENAPHVGQRLMDAHLLRSRDSFVTYINFHGLRPRLKVGIYSIRPNMSGGEIAEILAGGHSITKQLTVPEGYRLTQIETAAAALGLNKTEFLSALAAPHSQSFLSGKPQGVDLEGYLFPDSYAISPDTTASSLVNSMLDNFGKRVGPEYTQAYAAEGLTLHQGLTLASIVEREVNNANDRPVVAQIFLKRFREGGTLGSDVTAVYAAELLGVPFNVNIDSHYNTRRYPGLPPGPICSPGLGAMDAVAHPATTQYSFFLTGKDGITYFAKTYAEHQQNIIKHLQ